MAFKFTVSDPDSKRAVQVEIDLAKATSLMGKKIGDEIHGEVLGLPGYTLKITGRTDKDGFPMHPSIKGHGRKKALLSAPPGFHPKIKGQRKRKTIRGDTISQDIIQINVKIVKKGEKPLDQLVTFKPKPKKEEKVEKKEEPKQEEKPHEEKKEHVEVKEEHRHETKEEHRPEEHKHETKKPEIGGGEVTKQSK